MTALKNTLFIALLVLVSACQSFVTPQTFEQRLAYAQSQVGAAYNTVADLANRKQIDKIKAQSAIAEIDKADSAVKVARKAFRDGLFKDAESSLQAATSILVAIEASLKE